MNDEAYLILSNGDVYEVKSFEKSTTDIAGLLSNIQKGAWAPPEYHFTSDWFSWHIPFWEQSIDKAGKTKTDPLRILEIGAYEGKSTTWMSDNLLDHPDSILYSVDTFEGSIENQGQENLNVLLETYYSNISKSKNFRKIRPIMGNSHTVLPTLINQNHKFDIIYVDGAHDYEDVLQDGIDAFNLLKDDGLMIFDDYGWNLRNEYPVMRACTDLEKVVELTPINTTWQRAYLKTSNPRLTMI